MCMERRRFSQTMASEWQTAFVVSHKMPRCALLTAVNNYNKSLEKLPDFFFKTDWPRPRPRPKCSRPKPRPRLHYPRLSFLSSRRLETKTLVSRTTSLLYHWSSVPVNGVTIYGALQGQVPLLDSVRTKSRLAPRSLIQRFNNISLILSVKSVPSCTPITSHLSTHQPHPSVLWSPLIK